MSLAITRILERIEERINRATPWPWRAEDGVVRAPSVPPQTARTGGRADLSDFFYYGGELVAESLASRDSALIERAPEDLAFLCHAVRSLMHDRDRLDFLLDERFVCGSREEVDHLMATNKKPWEPLSIVRAHYEIVDETKAGAA